MASRKTQTELPAKKRRIATTPEARERQLVSMAMDRAEQQLVDGTASSQVITHFLKLGTTRDELEREKLKHENELLKARTEALQSAERQEELYKEALSAMKTYAGQSDEI